MNFSPVRSVSSCAIYRRDVSDQNNITVLLESLVRDIRFTLRSFRRTPLVALTIVATVGLGLGLIAVVFTILNAYVFRVDEVRNPHELFAVERQQSANAEPETFTRAQYETLVRETDVFSDAFASTGADKLGSKGTGGKGRSSRGIISTFSVSAQCAGARSHRRTINQAPCRSSSSAIAPGPCISPVIPQYSTDRSG